MYNKTNTKKLRLNELGQLIIFLEDYGNTGKVNFTEKVYEEIKQLLGEFFNSEEEYDKMKEELNLKTIEVRELNACLKMMRQELNEVADHSEDDAKGLPRSTSPSELSSDSNKKYDKSKTNKRVSMRKEDFHFALLEDKEQVKKESMNRNVLSKLSKKVKNSEQHLMEQLENVRREALKEIDEYRTKLKESEEQYNILQVDLNDLKRCDEEKITELNAQLEEK